MLFLPNNHVNFYDYVELYEQTRILCDANYEVIVKVR